MIINAINIQFSYKHLKRFCDVCIHKMPAYCCHYTLDFYHINNISI